MSRKSDLAIIQAKQVGENLKHFYPKLNIEYLFKKTYGDKDLKTPLSKMPEHGVFTDDLRNELIKNNCDIVVHSWKDLPLDLGKDTYIAGSLKRADQRDVIFVKKKNVNKILSSKKIKILSSSPRRIYNLKKFVSIYLPFKLENVDFFNIRGNIPTRFKKFLEGDCDAIVIAKAAIDRLLTNSFPEYKNLSNEIKKNIQKCRWVITPLSKNPTSPGQGALAIEILNKNKELGKAISYISKPNDIRCVNLERKILKKYGGGCHQKIGVSFIQTSIGIIHSEKGQTEDGKNFSYWGIYDKKKLTKKKVDKKTIFPYDLKSYSFFNRKVNKRNIDKISDIRDNCIWITRNSSLPEKAKISANNILWTSGLKTWRSLSKRGYWVNGTADGLGEDIDPNISSFTSFPWVKFTHNNAPKSRIKKIIKTYSLVERTNLFDFKEKKHFYWMSFSAFNLATKRNPFILEANHACGPGNTYKEIKKVIKDPKKLNVFLSYEEWRKELIDE